MTTWRGIRTLFVGSLLLFAAACAQDGGAAPGGSGESAGDGSVDRDGVALRVDQVGGLLPPAARVARLPMVAVYSDGRVIAQGPQILVYPGPALPNLQVQRIATEEVDRLVERARAAGVGAGTDLGRPSVADAPSTRFTVSSATGTAVLEVYALTEGTGQAAGLTEAQRTAREELQKLLAMLTDVSGALGPDNVGAAEPYRPDALAAVVSAWRDETASGLPAPPAVAWPGPPLPGAPLRPGLDQGCVEVRGAEATKLLEVAGKATAITPWTSGGDRWNVSLRPLLPDETGCADLSTE